MKLKEASLKFALKHVIKDGDTDLFPVPFEFKIIKNAAAKALDELKNVDINTHNWKGPRRLMVPKSEFAFRSVCQLDPMDALLFAALVREIGLKIEKRRSPRKDDKVFSYRFSPKADGSFYATNTGWEDFWRTSQRHAESHEYILVTDISDFYNQIYHHTIENQLILCGIKNSYWQSLKNLLANVTEGVSRGVPVGPHPAHILAELAMIPVDEFLDSLGVTWCRYVDDIHVFCKKRDDGHAALYKLVEYLDKTQKNQINKQKTNILKSSTFRESCRQNIMDQPISPIELEMLEMVRQHTSSPYQRISIKKLTATELEKLSQFRIESVLRDYLNSENVDYVRLRWFIRRLTQLGVPGGIEFIVKNFDDFLPAISEVGNYFESASHNFHGKWVDIGEELMTLYESGIVQASEYLQVIILSLFGRIKDLNHVNRLTAMYSRSSPMCQRKIMMAAAIANASAWLGSLKGEYKNADPWKRRAIIYSLRVLPKDEKQFWIKSVKKQVTGLDKLVAESVS